MSITRHPHPHLTLHAGKGYVIIQLGDGGGTQVVVSPAEASAISKAFDAAALDALAAAAAKVVA